MVYGRRRIGVGACQWPEVRCSVNEIVAGLLANPTGALGALGLGVIFGAVYTARATDRRERRAWQREKQVEAYRIFQEALWSSYFRITGGDARKVTQETREDGLEALNDANADDVDAVLRAVVDVAAYGDKNVSRYASGLAAAWEQWLYEATPLSGTQCWPSTLQRKRALWRVPGERGQLVLESCCP